jgi:hypothetical protein
VTRGEAVPTKERKILRIWVLVLIVALGGSSLHAEERPTFDSLWQLANSKPDHRTSDDGTAIRVEIPSEQTIYFFTKPGQPLHPAVVKRSVVTNGHQLDIQTRGWSFGPDSIQPAFQRWLEGFKAQDAEIRKRLQTQAHGSQN